MMSHEWHLWRKRVLAVAGSLLPAACISLFAFGFLVSPNRAYANDEAQAGDDATNDDAAKERNRRYLAEMRRRANATRVYRLDEGTRTPVKMRPEPLFRYSDQPHHIIDATVWAWGAKGRRPVALQKVEIDLDGRRGRDGFAGCLYCFVSLSNGLVAAEWSDAAPWSARKPGIHARPVPNAPEAAATEVRRLLQSKEIARRFSSTFEDDKGHLVEQRLLPRPICRYSDPDSGLVDGAIFFLTVYGTSAQLLVLIELHGENAANSTWEYALVSLTCLRFTVRMDQEEVWSMPAVWPKQRFDTWLYFWGSDLIALNMDSASRTQEGAERAERRIRIDLQGRPRRNR